MKRATGFPGRTMVNVPTGQGGTRGSVAAFEDSGEGLRINAANLIVPPISYVADVAWARASHGGVSLFFGKFRIDDKALRTCLEIRYTYESFVQTFWANSREFHALMNARAERRASLLVLESPPAQDIAVEKEHTEWANLEVMSRAANEACVDFFHLSARSLATYNKTKNKDHLDVKPVVRVILAADEMTRLLDQCEPIVEKVRPLANLEVL